MFSSENKNKNDDHLQLIHTDDGSHTIYNHIILESYHSLKGAISESNYIFIQKGLDYIINDNSSEINVFEVGFGSGLNALLTAIWSKKNNTSINYHTLEISPLHTDLLSKLNYTHELKDINSNQIFNDIHELPWNKNNKLHEYFNLYKILESLNNYKLKENRYELIYFDAFSPSKQPEMWTLTNLKNIINGLKTGGVLVTYCSQGLFKRNLKLLGMSVNVLAGPLGKKEMVRATKTIKM